MSAYALLDAAVEMSHPRGRCQWSRSL